MAWSGFSTAVVRDLTLHSAPSFGKDFLDTDGLYTLLMLANNYGYLFCLYYEYTYIYNTCKIYIYIFPSKSKKRIFMYTHICLDINICVERFIFLN